jgi:hypothetical protein
MALGLSAMAFGVCLAVCYMVMLGWESWLAVRALRGAVSPGGEA